MSDAASVRLWPIGASAEYIAARQELLAEEIHLRDERERVAERRRSLPAGAQLADYALVEGPADLSITDASTYRTRRLSELVTLGRELVVYHFMFATDWDQGCASCSMWIDGLHGVLYHLEQHITLAVIGAAPIDKLRRWAAHRGWNNLRLLSCHGTSFATDLGFEDQDGHPKPGVSVIGPGPTHVYSAQADMGTGEVHRGIDLLSPVWHVLDLLPRGRGDWNPTQR